MVNTRKWIFALALQVGLEGGLHGGTEGIAVDVDPADGHAALTPVRSPSVTVPPMSEPVAAWLIVTCVADT